MMDLFAGRRDDGPRPVPEAGRRDLRSAWRLGQEAGRFADHPDPRFISQHDGAKATTVARFDEDFADASTSFSEAARDHSDDGGRLQDAIDRERETAAAAAAAGPVSRLILRRVGLWFMIIFAGVFDFAGGLEVMKRFPSPGLISADAFRFLGAVGISLFIMVPASFAGRALHDAFMVPAAATAEERRAAPHGARRLNLAAAWLTVAVSMVLVVAVARATGDAAPLNLEQTPEAVEAVSVLRWELLLGIGIVTICGGTVAKFILARDDVYWEAHREHFLARAALDGVRGIGGIRRRHADSAKTLGEAVVRWTELRAREEATIRSLGVRYRSLHDAFTAGVRTIVPDHPVLIPCGVAVIPLPADDLGAAERRAVRALEREAARRLLALDPLALVVQPRDMPSEMARVAAALRGERAA